MEAVLNWGIDVILWFQQFSPALDNGFKILTSLGDKEFFLLLMPLIYWCIDRQTGTRLFMLLLISACLNEGVKLLADQPRPFNYDPRVQRPALARRPELIVFNSGCLMSSSSVRN